MQFVYKQLIRRCCNAAMNRFSPNWMHEMGNIETIVGWTTEINSIMLFKLRYYIYVEESFVMATTY